MSDGEVRTSRLWMPVGIGLVSAALLFSGCASTPEPDQDAAGQVEEEPAASVEEESVETEKTLEQRIEETKIEAGLSPEEYAETLQSRLDSWDLAGASPEAFDEWVQTGATSEYIDQLAASQTAVYTNSLFGPGYQNEESLVNSEINLTNRNAAMLSSWMRSYDFDNTTGTFEVGSVIENVELLSENPELGERVIYFAGYEVNNAEEAAFINENNRQNALDLNGKSWDHTLTLKTIGDTEYIIKWED